MDNAASLFKSIIKWFENCTLGTSQKERDLRENRRKAVFLFASDWFSPNRQKSSS
jgi:hypothetical protein